MSISFRGSILKDYSTGQVRSLNEAEIRDLIQTRLRPENNEVVSILNQLLLPNNAPLYNYMVSQINKYANEYNWILGAIHNSKNMSITCTIAAERDEYGNYSYYLPQYADNCYEYSLRDYLDVVLGPLMPIKMVPVQGVSISVHNPSFSLLNEEALMFRNPGWASGYGLGDFSGLGDLISADLTKCNVKHWRFNTLQEIAQYYSNPMYTAICWVYGDTDYHFYRYEPQFGVWTHKPGMVYPRCYDEKYQIITNPETCQWSPVYHTFGGYILAEIPATL